ATGRARDASPNDRDLQGTLDAPRDGTISRHESVARAAAYRLLVVLGSPLCCERACHALGTSPEAAAKRRFLPLASWLAVLGGRHPLHLWGPGLDSHGPGWRCVGIVGGGVPLHDADRIFQFAPPPLFAH